MHECRGERDSRATLSLMSSHAAALVFVVGVVAIRIVSRIATHYDLKRPTEVP